MKLSFDNRGYLKPYDRTEISHEEFKEFFIDAFVQNKVRRHLFDSYTSFTLDFRKKVTGDLRQWINGSFVSNKNNPKDIDIVNIIDYQCFESNEYLIRSQFIKEKVQKYYGIDAYLVILYPENHKLHNWTTSDLLYWHNWFTKSRMDRSRIRYPKGYIEINFGAFNGK